MFDYKIENAKSAIELMDDGWPTTVVSLVGPDLKYELNQRNDRHLIVLFHDFEGQMGKEELHGTRWADEDIIIPTREMMATVLAHTESLSDDDRLLVHCHAGRSRSTAMMIAILCQHGMTPREALEAARALRPTMMPNRLMTRFLDDLLGLEGRLEKEVEAYFAASTLPGIELRNLLGGWRG